MARVRSTLGAIRESSSRMPQARAEVGGAGLYAVDAGEGHGAEDAQGGEEGGESLFVAQAVLEGENGGVVFQEWADERVELVVVSGLEGYDDPVGFGHVAGVAV